MLLPLSIFTILTFCLFSIEQLNQMELVTEIRVQFSSVDKSDSSVQLVKQFGIFLGLFSLTQNNSWVRCLQSDINLSASSSQDQTELQWSHKHNA